MSADEAYSKLKEETNPKPEVAAAASEYSSESEAEEKSPSVVFFPAGAGGPGSCDDEAAAGAGFNTFAFLSFLLTAFNAIRLEFGSLLTIKCTYDKSVC
jgi:hypothetical protein